MLDMVAAVLAVTLQPVIVTPPVIPINCGTIIQPPPEYWGPLFYDPTIRTMDFFAIDTFCRQHGGASRGRFEACSFGRTIVIPRAGPGGVTLGQQACYFQHEKAHRMGWPGDHSGGSYE